MNFTGVLPFQSSVFEIIAQQYTKKQPKNHLVNSSQLNSLYYVLFILKDLFAWMCKIHKLLLRKKKITTWDVMEVTIFVSKH